MEGMALADVAEAVGGELVAHGDPSKIYPTGGCIDTRQLCPGEIFFALCGTNADGHRFIGAAFEKGAAAVVEIGRAHV